MLIYSHYKKSKNNLKITLSTYTIKILSLVKIGYGEVESLVKFTWNDPIATTLGLERMCVYIENSWSSLLPLRALVHHLSGKLSKRSSRIYYCRHLQDHSAISAVHITLNNPIDLKIVVSVLFWDIVCFSLNIMSSR